MHDTSGEKSAPPKVPLLTPKFVVLSTWQPKSKDRTRCFPPRLPTHAGLRFEKAIVWPQPLLSNALGLMRHFHNGCALQTEGHRLAYRSSHLCSNSKPHVSATQCTSQINAYAHWAYDNATSIELDD
eukprot:GGOE01004157.1.p3 GENE.GGOE01004157.1~~GGOE01004157.1.p3  ORF type:complete len:127 (-),score=11.01 GGOE01004157.1:13-393(-)